MLKSSSLYLYSSNLGIFWLKIQQFWPSWIQNGADGHNFERGPPKDHSDKVWLKLAKWFLTRRLFAYLWLICIIGQNRQKFKVHKKSCNICLNSSNLGTFWLKIEQFQPFEDISIFSNGGHLGYRTTLTDIIFKGDHLRIIQTKFG